MRLCVIPGDGIGPEVMAAALWILRLLAPKIEIAYAEAGWGTFQQTGSALPAETLAMAQASDAVLFGAVASPSHPVTGYQSPIVALRRALDLYANIRPVRSGRWTSGEQPLVTGPVDFVVVRENTEGLYSGRERSEDDGDTTIAERVITRRGSERVVRQAFDLARSRASARSQEAELALRLSKVTIVHKANVLRVTDGLFRKVALEVARHYPEIAVEELLVDTAAMHLAQSPRRFDVIVTTNLFGDILSDVGCIHGGGLGMASSANLGDRYALFEPVHGAAPDITGRGTANPVAAFGCLVLLLQWMHQRGLGATEGPSLDRRAAALQTAIITTLRDGVRTPDLGGSATTEDMTRSVLEYMQALLAHQA